MDRRTLSDADLVTRCWLRFVDRIGERGALVITGAGTTWSHHLCPEDDPAALRSTIEELVRRWGRSTGLPADRRHEIARDVSCILTSRSVAEQEHESSVDVEWEPDLDWDVPF